MRFAYADPPYPGQSAKHYADHPDYAGEVDHGELLRRIDTYDGWVLHTAATTLSDLLLIAADNGVTGFRIMAWVKPFAAFKRNVSVAYAWEPVLVKPVRKPVVTKRIVMRDWVSESITLRRGLTGAKPEAVCRWVFEVGGLQPDDELVDLFPGSGAVTRAWEAWRSQLRLPEQLTDTERMQEFAARYGIPLPAGLHVDSNIYGPMKPPPKAREAAG